MIAKIVGFPVVGEAVNTSMICVMVGRLLRPPHDTFLPESQARFTVRRTRETGKEPELDQADPGIAPGRDHAQRTKGTGPD